MIAHLDFRGSARVGAYGADVVAIDAVADAALAPARHRDFTPAQGRSCASSRGAVASGVGRGRARTRAVVRPVAGSSGRHRRGDRCAQVGELVAHQREHVVEREHADQRPAGDHW